MLETQLVSNAMLMGYAEMLLQDIEDADFAVQPAPGINHPAWILGHLAYAADGAVGLLGGEKLTDRDWSVKFGRDSKITGERSDYPSRDEMLKMFRETHAREQARGEEAVVGGGAVRPRASRENESERTPAGEPADDRRHVLISADRSPGGPSGPALGLAPHARPARNVLRVRRSDSAGACAGRRVWGIASCLRSDFDARDTGGWLPDFKSR